MSIFQVPLWVTQKNKSFLLGWICGNSSIHVQLVIMHCAERWILLSKMKYKLCCVVFQLFFQCKKNTITRGTHAKIFNFVLTPVPDSHFSRLFSSPPPPLIRKRGEKISERTLDQSCDDILVNTFGDCPTTIWQTVIG